MRLVLYLFLNFSIVGLFLYSKLLPYKDRLSPRNRSLFNFFDGFFDPVLRFFKRFFKPWMVGQGLAVDMTQVILLLLFLMLLKFV